MSDKVVRLIEGVKTLIVLELSGLVKALEEGFDVSTTASVAVAAAPAAAAVPIAEERTEFDVVLRVAGANKIQVIKAIREITGLSLKEAKELVDSAPRNVKEGASKNDVEAIRVRLTEAGAETEVK